MTTSISTTVAINGHRLESGSGALGDLTRTNHSADPAVLRARLEEEGYLYLPGFFQRSDVFSVREVLTERLAGFGALDPVAPPIEAVAAPELESLLSMELMERLADNNEPMHRLLYEGRLMTFYESLLGGAVRHFDYTWIRSAPRGTGTWAHTDIVFMGRGTTNLYTSWVPYGDLTYEMGGLAILEHSHNHDEIRNVYGQQDVDTYCENLGQEPEDYAWPHHNGILDDDAAALRRKLGGRWLTAEFRAGDLLVFGMYTAHGGLDNQTDFVRLSSDSRYQLASEPVDERWVGEQPIGHKKGAKRGLIC